MRKSWDGEQERQRTPSETIRRKVGIRDVQSNFLDGTASDSRANGCLDEGEKSEILHTIATVENDQSMQLMRGGMSFS